MQTEVPVHTEAVHTDLFGIVDKLVGVFSPGSLYTGNIIFNEVSPELAIKSDKKIIFSVLRDILESVIFHSTNTCVRISARVYNDVILLHIKDCRRINDYIKYYSFDAVQRLAMKIGGFVDVTSYNETNTTITFSFANMPVDQVNLYTGNDY